MVSNNIKTVVVLFVYLVPNFIVMNSILAGLPVKSRMRHFPSTPPAFVSIRELLLLAFTF